MKEITAEFAAGYHAALADIDRLSERLTGRRLIGLTWHLEKLIKKQKPGRKPKQAGAGRAPPPAIDQGAADKAVAERNFLYRQYRAARKKHRDAIYSTHPLGPELQTFAYQLTRYTQLSDASAMLNYVREMARGWLALAPPEIRAEALSLVNERIITIRTHAGLTPFDDPLPGEEADVFQLCKTELS